MRRKYFLIRCLFACEQDERKNPALAEQQIGNDKKVFEGTERETKTGDTVIGRCNRM